MAFRFYDKEGALVRRRLDGWDSTDLARWSPVDKGWEKYAGHPADVFTKADIIPREEAVKMIRAKGGDASNLDDPVGS